MTDNLAGTFLEIARIHAAQDYIHITRYCVLCGETTRQTLVEEEKITEVYACDKCGLKVSFTVR